MEEIRKLVGNGSVLVVGNGEVVNKEASADTVVRMNYGVIDGCDMWIDNFTYLPMAVNYKVPQKYKKCIRLDRGAKEIEGRPAYILPVKEFRKMVEEVGIERPTTGLQTLWFFKTFFLNNELLTTGFSGEINRYSKLKMKKNGAHKLDRERMIYREWEHNEVFRSV